MVSDVFLPKLLDGHPVTFVRAEGLNDFVVRVNSEKERTISRELWCSLMDHGFPISASGEIAREIASNNIFACTPAAEHRMISALLVEKDMPCSTP
jgi:hypothetical protein